MEIDAPKIAAAVLVGVIGLAAGRGCTMWEEHTEMCVRLESLENQVAIQWEKIGDLEDASE